MAWHRVHDVLAFVHSLVDNPTNIQPHLIAHQVVPRDVSAAALRMHKLHVLARTNSTLVVRQFTVLNATSSETLLSAIKARGLAGVALYVVYAEYEGAYEHVHSYSESAVHRSPTHVWHANVAPPPSQGALARWRACGGGRQHEATQDSRADKRQGINKTT
jgi:hypothetical protein